MIKIIDLCARELREMERINPGYTTTGNVVFIPSRIDWKAYDERKREGMRRSRSRKKGVD
jgi:hypothetical protein